MKKVFLGTSYHLNNFVPQLFIFIEMRTIFRPTSFLKQVIPSSNMSDDITGKPGKMLTFL